MDKISSDLFYSFSTSYHLHSQITFHMEPINSLPHCPYLGQWRGDICVQDEYPVWPNSLKNITSNSSSSCHLFAGYTFCLLRPLLLGRFTSNCSHSCSKDVSWGFWSMQNTTSNGFLAHFHGGFSIWGILQKNDCLLPILIIQYEYTK